ncbi:hypothetical protein GQ55_2G132600 [Panicum hallii var. hallii]|jgi:hypothetical protein|uniref:Uncharacterized protein n=1 Tax=Panicum hallii var. hallii TaxID=1504633 RepID=A0A2T7EPG8_9POAL|nr:hypothetical protein GQ55_2G132600 [Panicum hallii var. hallii]
MNIYLKDEPWLTLLCKKMQLDMNEIINDVTTKTSEASFYADNFSCTCSSETHTDLMMELVQAFLVLDDEA